MGYAPSSGDKFAVQRFGNIAVFYVDVGAGWRRVAALYSTSPNSGKLALKMAGSSERGDDFGGGPLGTGFIQQTKRYIA